MKNRVKLDVENLKIVLKESGIKKQDIAVKIGVSRETFSRWLSGRVEFVEEKSVIKLSEILGCRASDISPEIPEQEDKSGLDPNLTISGEEFIKLGLFSNQWHSLLNLYAASGRPEIVRDHEINLQLFTAIKSLLDLTPFDNDFRIGHQEYELFDIIARQKFIDAVASTLKGDTAEADALFRQVIFQGQSEWLVALSYLGAGITSLLAGDLEKTEDFAEKGIDIFSKSFDELTLFAVANLYLLLVWAQPQDLTTSQSYLNNARRLFGNIGYLFGHQRLEFYDLFVYTMFERKPVSKSRLDRLLGDSRKLPTLFKIEVLMICSVIAKHSEDDEGAGDFLRMAVDLQAQYPAISFFLKLELWDHNRSDQLKEELQALVEKGSLPEPLIISYQKVMKKHEKSSNS